MMLPTDKLRFIVLRFTIQPMAAQMWHQPLVGACDALQIGYSAVGADAAVTTAGELCGLAGGGRIEFSAASQLHGRIITGEWSVAASRFRRQCRLFAAKSRQSAEAR